MILAAGRGERMRPLSDVTPKPLLCAGGKPLIVWQIEAFVRAGLTDIVINASHRADDLAAALGDGRTFGARIAWSREAEPLEVAGGIATALPLLPAGPSDRRLGRRLERIRRRDADSARADDGAR